MVVAYAFILFKPAIDLYDKHEDEAYIEEGFSLDNSYGEVVDEGEVISEDDDATETNDPAEDDSFKEATVVDKPIDSSQKEGGAENVKLKYNGYADVTIISKPIAGNIPSKQDKKEGKSSDIVIYFKPVEGKVEGSSKKGKSDNTLKNEGEITDHEVNDQSSQSEELGAKSNEPEGGSVESQNETTDDAGQNDEGQKGHLISKVKFLKKPKFAAKAVKKTAKSRGSKKRLIHAFHDRHGDIVIYSKPKYSFYTIRMHNLNTGEHLATVFYQNGQYSVEGLKKINKFLRDYRTGEITRIDPKVIMLVYKISRRLKNKGYIQVISGYRSKKTNNRLRRMGRKVAKKSMHSEGKAIDIKIPGVSTRRLRDVAKSYRAGGVGYYPRDGFVHVDTGTIRSW